ncbi:hypothetical protein [Gemmatimonas sp.]|jgi:hypothetical protein|uniref:hypothetical protein n=1 Tax=Gemmatimonas sp. TaxID=1962908 RepID=UPI0027B92DF5|nr:hypothetical protein [Gemmatimonas sp.]
MIAVYSGDRTWRLAVERLLRAQGVAVRTASRPAELAKALADGAVGVVLVGPATADGADVAKIVTPAQTVVCALPGEATNDVVHRATGRS